MPDSSSITEISSQPLQLRRRFSRFWGLVPVCMSGLLSVSCGNHAQGAPREEPDLPRLEGNSIRFSEKFAKRIELKSIEVKKAAVVPSLAVVGTVTFDPEHVARVGTRLRGLVREVRHFEGDIVKRGEVLASVDSPELGDAQATVLSLQAELDAARRNAEREKKLSEDKLTTLKETEEATARAERFVALLAAAEQKVSALAGVSNKTSSRAIGVHTVSSPLDGTIVERHVSKGQLVEGDHTAFLVANLDHLWVELAVFERSLPSIRVGDEVELRPLGGSAAALKGRVAHVGQVLNAATRSSPVRVEVENKERLLRPGQAVDAVIRAAGASADAGPVVPPSAVTFVDGKPTIFVQDSPTSVRVASVELGASDGQGLHIKKGVEVGQKVVVDGTFELKSELFR
ncbi:MAG TPA: efflux RND transporter periplasmic adaptor subunit [Polyangiaceae bacterium]|nr:efflux RND transporter periplasmic adaptor subunit [Polyangiaceae bacterium]